MTETIDIPHQLGEDVTNFSFEQLQNILVDSGDLDESEKLELLRRIYEEEYEEEDRRIIRSLITPKWRTTAQEAWPVAPEFPEPVSDACVEFCDYRGLNLVLIKCLKQARKIFSNIKNLYAELDYFKDDEAQDIGHVVIRLEVGSDQGTTLDEYDAWVDWMVNSINPNDSAFLALTVKRI